MEVVNSTENRDNPIQEETGGSKKENSILNARTEQEWAKLIHTRGLLVVDLFSDWCGPCTAMEIHLKKMKVANANFKEQVTLARACCDDIEELAPFRADPRPTWLFMSSGIPTALLRGVNKPLLAKLFVSELRMESGARPPIMIDYRSPAVIQCCGPLGLLAADRTIHSIGTGKTEMLTSLFQDMRARSPRFRTPPPATDQENNLINTVQEVNQCQELCLNPCDLLEVEDEEEDEVGDDIDEIAEVLADNPELAEEVGETRRNTEVRKPRRKRELRAGLLKEILSNRGNKRPTFSGLFM